MNFTASQIATFCLTVGLCTCWVPAQSEISSNADRFGQGLPVILLQGEALRVSRDFVVKLDAEKLRVALTNQGIIGSIADQELTVVLIQPGSSTQESIAGRNGELVFDNVKSGLSVILVMGEKATAATSMATYAAFAFFATALDEAGADQAQPLQIPLGVTRTQALVSDLSSAAISPRVSQINAVEDYNLDPPQHFRVYRQRDGSLIGRLQVPQERGNIVPSGVALSLLQNGEIVAQTVSAADGSFQLPDIRPGVYTVIATGQAGHACFSFELVESERRAFNRRLAGPASTRFVMQQLAAAQQLNILLIPPVFLPQVQQIVKRKYGNSNLAEADAVGSAIIGAGILSGSQDNGPNAGAGAALAGSNTNFAGGGSGGGVGGGASSAGGGNSGAAVALLGAAGIALGTTALNDGDDGFTVRAVTPITR